MREAIRPGLITLLLAAPGVHAANPMLGEVELEPATRAERNAGVWVDGQYMGYVRDLDGKDSLMLVPGKHALVFRLAGYEPLRSQVTVEPGTKSEYRLAMRASADAAYPNVEDTARVRLAVEPEDAAVFVNGTYAGHVDQFDGRRGMRIAAGTYELTIALPGYESFETRLSVRAGQTYEIETKLPTGPLENQAANLTSD